MSDIFNNMPDNTYMDKYIKDGNKAIVNLKHLYDTILIQYKNNEDKSFRIPYNDFFLKYRNQLADIVEYQQILQTEFYQPKTVSLRLYGTTELWLALLRINNMKNITEFHYPLIKVYNANMLKTLIDTFFKREKIIT